MGTPIRGSGLRAPHSFPGSLPTRRDHSVHLPGALSPRHPAHPPVPPAPAPAGPWLSNTHPIAPRVPSGEPCPCVVCLPSSDCWWGWGSVETHRPRFWLSGFRPVLPRQPRTSRQHPLVCRYPLPSAPRDPGTPPKSPGPLGPSTDTSSGLNLRLHIAMTIAALFLERRHTSCFFYRINPSYCLMVEYTCTKTALAGVGWGGDLY